MAAYILKTLDLNNGMYRGFRLAKYNLRSNVNLKPVFALNYQFKL